ncbi:uncharacterized protein LOC131427008 [Malaya genurostris]|uniref:uncharacterized protein LOC131427008 n=1 Tax=Malaya genurostris TaxID=325434 RepID=UPI0026F3D379|nr:uncharacterized protein LOC131427008 [Malaya genurostris]
MANIHNGFFKLMNSYYGYNTAQLFKVYAQLNRKLCNMSIRKYFLVQCRKTGLFPNHIVNSLKCIHPLLEERSPYTHKLQRTTERFKKSILNIEIKQTFFKIKCLHRELDQLQQQLTQATNSTLATQFIATQNQSVVHRTKTLQRTTGRKLKKLIKEKTATPDSPTPTLNPKAILNATNVTIPEDTITLLSLGKKFSMPITNTNTIPFYHMLADIESILRTSPNQAIQDRNRCLVATHIQNYISKLVHRQIDTPLHTFCKKASSITKKFINDNQDICIIEADKGNRTVIMYKQDHDRKMHELLDKPTYQKTSRDPTPSIQRQNNMHIIRLLNLKLIDNSTATRLKSTTAICPQIYGQPKAHKPDLPLRPVVPNITAPTYQLSKYLASILQRSTHSEFNVSDSFQFITNIKQITLPPNYVLVSFDVVSLFTNIPLDLVIHDIIMDWNNIKAYTNINLDLFLELIEFCVKSSYFRFQDKYYMQTFGTAMGSPLSPILANIVMDNLLHTVTKQLPFNIPIVRKYVDDLFLALPKDQIQYTMDTFNAYNSYLQFTKEDENNNQLPFLDVMITRNSDQTLCTRWYAKPIASGRLLNYHSFHPLTVKMNVAHNFIKRVMCLTTDNNVDTQNIIFQHLRRNNYPSKLINRIIHRNKHQRYSLAENAPTARNSPNSTEQNSITTNSTDQITIRTDPPIYRSLPYITSLSPAIINTLKTDYDNITISTKPINTIARILPNIKQPIDLLSQFNVIYSLPCENCKMNYIGMTRNHLKTRLYGHKSNINQYDKLKSDGAVNTDERMIALGKKLRSLNIWSLIIIHLISRVLKS